MSYDKLMSKLPSSTNDDFIELLNSFMQRSGYIEKFGFVPLTDEFLGELISKFKKLRVKNFLELGAGTGFLTKVLNDYGLPGIGISLEIPEAKHHWGLSPSPIYNYCIENNLLQLGDMTEIQVEVPDLVVSSWVPLGGGHEVMEFMQKNGYPEWYLLIGEGEGGCTGSETFNSFVEDNFDCVYRFSTYRSFAGIHDKALLYCRRRETQDGTTG